MWWRISLLILLFQGQLWSQTAILSGTITDAQGVTLPGVQIETSLKANGTALGVASQADGRYKLVVPAGRAFDVTFSFTGLKTERIEAVKLAPDEVRKLDIQLFELTNEGPDVTVVDFRQRASTIIELKDVEDIPNTTGNLENLIVLLAPGVSSGTGGELTSQYSVRGGNYDENLVYVNDFQIYRPLLIRSGQQEGLTFPNPYFLDRLYFSSGGFSAEYGDKMSSVLDVHYRRPTKFGATAEGSLLGAAAHIEGAKFRDTSKFSFGERFTYMLGVRYKTTQYLLNSLDVTGEYVPQFLDIQANLTYDLSSRWQWEFLGSYNDAIYRFVPESRQSATGLYDRALRLTALFNGQERSNFRTFMLGSSLRYSDIERKFTMKFLASTYQSNENEEIDIESFYRFEEIESGLGSDNFGQAVGTLGYGESHLYARNYLQSNVTNVQWKFAKELTSGDRSDIINQHTLRGGVKFQHERIDDRLKEWVRDDSLGYTVPFDTTSLGFPEVLKTQINLASNRLTAYVQDDWNFANDKHDLQVSVGVRANYWDLNKELVVSPRAQILYAPKRFRHLDSDSTHRTKELIFKLAGGAYFQPPFYRELRNFEGEINRQISAQKSWQGLAGIVWDLTLFKRRFKFIAEAYYKHQYDLIAYDIDNVRVRYYGENNAEGYVTGLDLRLNGSFIEGTESWINLSFMRAREALYDVTHLQRKVGEPQATEVKDVPKPTDQLMLLTMYFQDYLPSAPWLRVNLAFTVGTGFPFGVPDDNQIFRNTYRYSAYHRIDVGFSASIWDRQRTIREKFNGNAQAFKDSDKHLLKSFKKLWLSLEVFNLMAVSNEASNTWIKDFSNQRFAISNFLTSRRINLRLRATF